MCAAAWPSASCSSRALPWRQRSSGWQSPAAAADKLGIQYIASGRYARIETDAQGMSHLFAPESGAPDESGTLAALPPEVLSRLILPLGDFAPEDVAEMAEDFKL